MEGDATFSPRGLTSGDFNPRPPWGGRLRNRTQETPSVGISIHALRGEGDCIADFYFSTALYFNPRPPWGGRPRPRAKIKECTKFQSTPSVGRATPLRKLTDKSSEFQSTPSVGRATLTTVIFVTSSAFQSTPSVGRTTKTIQKSIKSY